MRTKERISRGTLGKIENFFPAGEEGVILGTDEKGQKITRTRKASIEKNERGDTIQRVISEHSIKGVIREEDKTSRRGIVVCRNERLQPEPSAVGRRE